MALEPYVENNGPFNRKYWGTAAPAADTDGTFEVGDEVVDITPEASTTPGWICTTRGSPGTWKARAVLGVAL